MQDKVVRALLTAWGEDTSYSPKEWSTENPARGQCAVSSLVIQDYLGGEIVRCVVEGEEDSHFYNILTNAEELDVTCCQFDAGVSFTDVQTIPRVKILKSADMHRRYALLSNRVKNLVL